MRLQNLTTFLNPPETDLFHGHIAPVAEYPGASPRQAARLNFHHALMNDRPAAARVSLAALDTAIKTERGRA